MLVSIDKNAVVRQNAGTSQDYNGNENINFSSVRKEALHYSMSKYHYKRPRQNKRVGEIYNCRMGWSSTGNCLIS